MLGSPRDVRLMPLDDPSYWKFGRMGSGGDTMSRIQDEREFNSQHIIADRFSSPFDSKWLLKDAAFPDLLSEDSVRIKASGENILYAHGDGGAEKNRPPDLNKINFPDLWMECKHSMDHNASACRDVMFPDIDDLYSKVPLSTPASHDSNLNKIQAKPLYHQNEYQNELQKNQGINQNKRLDEEFCSNSRAQRFKEEQEARVKQAAEIQRLNQEGVYEGVSHHDIELNPLTKMDQASLSGFQNFQRFWEEESCCIDDDSALRCINLCDRFDNMSRSIGITSNMNTSKNQDCCTETSCLKLDFDPQASYELGLQTDRKARDPNGDHKPNSIERVRECILFNSQASNDGSQITSSVILDDGIYDSSENITTFQKYASKKELTKIGSPKWNDRAKNPHTTLLSSNFDSMRIHSALNIFSDKLENFQSQSEDDVWSIGNPIAEISSLISAPRLCDATSQIPYSISFSCDEDDNDFICNGSKIGSLSRTRNDLQNSSKGCSHIVPSNDDISIRIKKKLADIGSRSRTYHRSTSILADEKSNATASLTLSKSTDMQSSIKSGFSDKMPVCISKFDKNRPWRKPSMILHQVHEPRSTHAPISLDMNMSEDDVIIHLKSRIQNLIAENIPKDINVDRHNIILDNQGRRRPQDEFNSNTGNANEIILHGLRSRLRELECDYGSLKSEKSSRTGKSVEELKSKLRRLELSHQYEKGERKE